LAKKKAFRKIYQEVFNDLPYIKFQKEYDNAEGSWWLTCIKIEKEIDISNLMIKLKEKEIPTRRVFMPASEMPYLKDYSRSCPNTYEIYKKGICLPSSTLNEEKDISEAALKIKEILYD
jgi:perosamine synthetase